MEYLVVDGKIYQEDEINLTQIYRDETFRLSQNVWFGFGGIPLFSENIELFHKQILKLNLQTPTELNNSRELFRITKRMLNKNKFYRSGLINMVILWNNNSPHLIFKSEAFSGSGFPFRKEGVLLNNSKQKKYSSNHFNRYRFFNESLWKVALAEIRNTPFQNTVISNEKEVVCECAYQNIYMIKGRRLLTPSIKTGCFEDTIRKNVLRVASEISLEIEESDNLNINDMMDMDEIFLISEEKGIEWILGVENKRFIHHFSIVIHRKLNEYLEEKVH